VRPCDRHVRLLRRGTEDLAVSADAALAFVRTARSEGGMLPLLATALLMMLEAGLILGGAAAPALWLAAVVVLVPLRYLVKRGLRSTEAARAIEDAARLAPPLSAALTEHVLLLGTTGAAPEDWCAVPVSESQERHIRTLALPGAYLRRP
jgi:hypothetical protein